MRVVTLWKSTREEIRLYEETRKPAGVVSADAIARFADKGDVDVTARMLEELNQAAQDLKVSRQAVIKTVVRQALDQHYLAKNARRRG